MAQSETIRSQMNKAAHAALRMQPPAEMLDILLLPFVFLLALACSAAYMTPLLAQTPPLNKSQRFTQAVAGESQPQNQEKSFPYHKQAGWLNLALAASSAEKNEKLEQSERLFKEAAKLAVNDNVSCYRTGYSFMHLGYAYMRKKDFIAAAQAYRQAINVLQTMGDGPMLAACLDRLAECLTEQNHYDELDALYSRSAKIRENNPIRWHDAINIPLIYGGFYERKGDFKRAEELYKQALSMSESCHKRDHGLCVSHLIELAMRRGQLEESAQLCKEALLHERMSPEFVSTILLNQFVKCGSELVARKKYTDAESLYKAIIVRIRQIAPLPRELQSKISNGYVTTLKQLHHEADAEQLRMNFKEYRAKDLSRK